MLVLRQKGKKNIEVPVITADTHGTVAEKLLGLPCALHIIGSKEQDSLKDAYVRSLGVDFLLVLYDKTVKSAVEHYSLVGYQKK